MIKTSKTDSIIDIINKINSSELKENVELILHHKNPISTSKSSLLFLKQKVRTNDFTIFTRNPICKELCDSLEIKCNYSGDPSETNFKKHNLSILEYLGYELKSVKNIFNINKQFKYIKNISKTGRNKEYSNLILLMLLLVVFCAILIYSVFYFAIHKTTIIISPQINVKTISKNIIFRYSENPVLHSAENIIDLEKYSDSAILEETFQTSGILEGEIKNSKGKITIFNEKSEEINLRDNTRFVTENGIIFLLDKWTILPSASQNEEGNIIPSETIADVTASIRDSSGRLIGERGNISELQNLSLPGLGEDKTIYAKIDFSEGGETPQELFLTEGDLENAKKYLTGKIEFETRNMIDKKISERNSASSSKYNSLNFSDAINFSEIQFEIVNNAKVLDKIPEFSLKASMDFTSYLYNQTATNAIIEKEVKNFILPGIATFLAVDYSTVRHPIIINVQKNPLEIKATLEANYSVKNVFKNQEFYFEKLKGDIAGIPLEDAKNIILQDSNIAKVNIIPKPFFMKEIAPVKDNIEFRVEN